MNLFIIQSYPQLINLFHCIESNENKPLDIIVIGNKELWRFLNEFRKKHNTLRNLLFLKEPRIDHRKPGTILKYIIWRIRLFNQELLKNRYDKVFFSSYEFAGINGVLLKKVLTTKILHLKDPGCDYYRTEKLRTKGVRMFLRESLLKILYGNSIELASITPSLNYTSYVNRLSESLIKKINIKLQSTNERQYLLRNLKLEKYLIDTYYNKRVSVVFISKDMISSNLVDPQIFKNEMKKVLNILTQRYGIENILIKLKPGKKSHFEESFFNKFNHIPDYLPFEYLKFQEDVKVIGFSSTAIARSKYETISILNLIEIIDKNKVEKSIIQQNKRAGSKKINYPKSIDDFKSLL